MSNLNPTALFSHLEKPASSPLRVKVEAAMERIRPAVEADGGGIELVNVKDDGTVEVRMTGGCVGCAMSSLTLKAGVERYLKAMVPEVKTVEALE